jgi:hypothetical protein
MKSDSRRRAPGGHAADRSNVRPGPSPSRRESSSISASKGSEKRRRSALRLSGALARHRDLSEFSFGEGAIGDEHAYEDVHGMQREWSLPSARMRRWGDRRRYVRSVHHERVSRQVLRVQGSRQGRDHAPLESASVQAMNAAKAIVTVNRWVAAARRPSPWMALQHAFREAEDGADTVASGIIQCPSYRKSTSRAASGTRTAPDPAWSPRRALCAAVVGSRT